MAELTEEQKMKFKIIKILEDWRWEDFPEDFESNFGNYSFKDEIKETFYGGKDDGSFSANKDNENHKILAEKILLTHYLIYICNRQMNANRVFNEGLSVISQIVKDYYEYEDNNFDDFIINHIETDESGKHRLKAEGNTFASRNTAQDYYCIFRTLKTLNKDKKLFSKYLKKNDINALAESLYQLTYKGITIIKSSDKDFISVYGEYEQTAKDRQKDNMDRHKQKRLWCLIRDYLYHPVFKELFNIVLGDSYTNFFDKKGNEVKNASSLELPGDVWNNNSTFAGCFWGEENLPKNRKGELSENYNSSKFVRKQFNDDSQNGNNLKCWGGCYPHQFDITFNLVPRMCESDNCSMCPICENKGMDKWQTLCHKTKNKYCSFALYATGIKHECKYGEKAADNDKSTGCELLDAIQDKK